MNMTILFLILILISSTRHTEELSVGLGASTNNYGELWAIAMVWS